MWISVLCLSSLVVFCAGQTAEQLAKVDTTKASVRQLILYLINACRRNVNPTARKMAKVSWSDEAAKTAEQWAKKCTFKHSKDNDKKITDGDCGENLYMTSYRSDWQEAIKVFCDEQENFIHGQGKKNKTDVTEHFTQLVWQNSHKVGCYCAYCTSGKFRWYFVCHHFPRGNIGSPIKEAYKAGPSCADCPNNCDDRLCNNPCAYYDKSSDCSKYKDHCYHPRVKENCGEMCKCPKKS